MADEQNEEVAAVLAELGIGGEAPPERGTAAALALKDLGIDSTEDTEPLDDGRPFRDLGVVDGVQKIGENLANQASTIGGALLKAPGLLKDAAVATGEAIGQGRFGETFEAGADRIREGASEIAQQVIENPRGAIDATGRAVATGAGFALGGGGSGGTLAVPGAAGANYAWRLISDVVGLSDENFGLDRSLKEIGLEVAGELSGEIALSKGGKLLSPPKSLTRKRPSIVGKKADELLAKATSKSSRTDNIVKAFGAPGGATKEELEFAARTIGDELLESNRLVIEASPNPRGDTPDIISDWLRGPRNAKGRRSGGGFLDIAGKQVNEAIEKSSATFSLDDVESVVNKGFGVDPAGIPDPELARVIRQAKTPMVKSLAKKAGMTDLDAATYVTQKDELAKQTFQRLVKGKGGKDIRFLRESTEAFEARVADTQLTAMEAFDATREGLESVRFGAGFTPPDQARLLGGLRTAAKERVKSGMSDDLAAAYDAANDRYRAGLTLAGQIEKIPLQELQALGGDRTILLEGGRFFRDIKFFNAQGREAFYDLMLNAYSASDKPGLTRTIIQKASRGLAPSDTLNDLFSLPNVAAVTAAFEGVQEAQANPQVQSAIGKELDDYMGGLVKYAEYIERGIEAGKGAYGRLAKDMANDPLVKPFLNLDSGKLLDGVMALGGVFFGMEDEERFRRNLRNAPEEVLKNRQKARVTEELNKTGRVPSIPTPKIGLEPGELAEIDRERDSEASVTALRKLSSPMAIVKARRTSQLIEETSE